MRLILKTKNDLVVFYRISVTSTTITGWYRGDIFRREFNIPKERHFDSHFTYPVDGGYHFTFISQNSDREEYIYVYWDNVRIKTITTLGKTDVWLSREEFTNDKRYLLGHLMVNYRPKPLKEVRRFSFPTVDLTVFNGDFHRKHIENIISETKIKNDDFVVDISNLNNFSVNVSAHLRNKEEQPIGMLSLLSHWDNQVRSYEVFDNLVIDLGCSFGFNDKV